MEWWPLILGALIVLGTFYVASIAGFGSSALTVSFLTLFLDVKLVIPVLIILSFVFNLVLIGKHYRKAQWSALFPLVMGNLIGTTIGVWLFSRINSQTLVHILGVVIIIAAWDIAIKKNWPEFKFKKTIGTIAGAAAGFSEMLFSISSPPVVFYLANFIREKEILRSTIITFFAIASTIGVISLLTGGLISLEIVETSLIFTPSAVLGTWLGHRTSLKINEKLYRIVISGVLIFSGLLLIFSA